VDIALDRLLLGRRSFLNAHSRVGAQHGRRESLRVLAKGICNGDVGTLIRGVSSDVGVVAIVAIEVLSEWTGTRRTGSRFLGGMVSSCTSISFG
jgi:hypothetical protein